MFLSILPILLEDCSKVSSLSEFMKFNCFWNNLICWKSVKIQNSGFGIRQTMWWAACSSNVVLFLWVILYFCDGKNAIFSPDFEIELFTKWFNEFPIPKFHISWILINQNESCLYKVHIFWEIPNAFEVFFQISWEIVPKFCPSQNLWSLTVFETIWFDEKVWKFRILDLE